MNKKASFTTSSNIIFWLVIILPTVALSLAAFVYLTSTTTNSDLDISEIKHFTLKQVIIDECLSSNKLFDINKLNDQNINNCIDLGASTGLSIRLEDLEGNVKKDLIKNNNLINRMVFCKFDEKLRCSTFKQIVLVNGIVHILNIKLVNENE